MLPPRNLGSSLAFQKLSVFHGGPLVTPPAQRALLADCPLVTSEGQKVEQNTPPAIRKVQASGREEQQHTPSDNQEEEQYTSSKAGGESLTSPASAEAQPEVNIL